ncbi:MAG: GNAT family protein [Gaiellaceae bacterium]
MSESKLRLRRATPHDVDYLLALQVEPEAAHFLSAGRASTHEQLLAEVERSLAEPEAFGRLLVEVPFEREWRLAGAIGFERTNRRSRIAHLSGLAVHPDFRGHGLGAAAIRELARVLFGELGFHRLEAETYGFNERAMAVVERAGFVREGVKRRAYWRDPEWVDGVCFALTVEDIQETP